MSITIVFELRMNGSAPRRTENLTKKDQPIKHIIEAWGGRYVSQDDVQLAAALHPNIRGKYPNYNISSRLVRPLRARLNGISEAGTQAGYMDRYQDAYAVSEED